MMESMKFFFFSSRRRHTRLQGDWSSDVCSSDLRPPWTACTPCCTRSTWTASWSSARARRTRRPCSTTARRSEERRVGKERGWGGGKYQADKKLGGLTGGRKGRGKSEISGMEAER